MNLCRASRADGAGQPLRIPAGAFSLGIALFSGSLREALLCGVLAVWGAVLAAFLTGLTKGLPIWSARSSVLLLCCALTAAAFRWADFALGGEMGWRFAASGGLIGLLAAWECLAGGWEGRYGALLAQAGLGWGLWLLCGAARELLAAGSLFGWEVVSLPIQSAAFGETAFGFFAAGIILGAVCAAARGQCLTGGLLAAVPAVFLAAPLLPSAALLAGAALILFVSVRRTLAFSRTTPAFRRLPVEMLAFGIVLLVLGAY